MATLLFDNNFFTLINIEALSRRLGAVLAAVEAIPRTILIHIIHIIRCYYSCGIVIEVQTEGTDMQPLCDTILDYIPAPEGDPEAGTQVLISTIDYNEYVGRIGVGKVDNGIIKVNQDVIIVNHHEPDKQKKVKVSSLYEYDGLNKVNVKEASVGSIGAVSGIADIHIGDTICDPENIDPIDVTLAVFHEPTSSAVSLLQL